QLHLHPSPPRRSSDLIGREQILGLTGDQAVASDRRRERPSEFARERRVIGGSHETECVVQQAEGGQYRDRLAELHMARRSPSPEDRKSTRLNSSHVKI